MKESYVNLINIRRQVFAEIARIAYDDIDLGDIESASYRILPGEVASYRDSVFRERAVLDERLRFTLGLDMRLPTEYHRVTEGVEIANHTESIFNPPLVNVIPYACEACPTRMHKVTNNCRRCLAHPCTNVCPVNAVTMGDDRSHIDHEKCINCGRCKNSCPYNAIVETDRPCAAACGVKAIESDYLGRAKINSDKCVACGACIIQCPFGAIADKSQIYQLIKAMKSGRNVYAIIAPSFIGQFGPLASPYQVVEGIKELGFKDVVEVSLGADLTTIHEAEEYLHRVPSEIPYMATSCCYSWSLMVEKNFPDEFNQISDSSSPMVYAAEYVKKNDPEGLVTFIGPCISKKLEALKDNVKDKVNSVITFEELMGMFVAKGLELSEIEVSKEIEDASGLGRGYAVAGGVAEAVKRTAIELEPGREINVEGASTLAECIKLMRLAKAGKKDGYLLEGMACSGGCIAGPGTLASVNRVRKSIAQFVKESKFETPLENEKIKD